MARTFRFWLGFDAASSMTFQYSVIASSAERRSCSSGVSDLVGVGVELVAAVPDEDDRRCW